jgi:hypothetical protein
MNAYLVFHRTILRRVPLRGTKKKAFEVELLQRLGSTVSGLSLTRCGPVTGKLRLGLMFRFLETGSAS